MNDKRFYSLDAMRGVTALAIVVSHTGQVIPPEPLHFSYLGVDFFFMLSGFVLARAYAPKLRASLSSWRFMELRIIRLYPMFALGLLFGLLNAFGQIAAHSHHALDPAHVVLAFALHLFMLPDIFSRDILFTLNGPLWTLFFEIVINVAFGVLLFRLRSLFLAAISVACAIFYLWGHAELSSGNIGWAWNTIFYGLARTGFAFPLGVVLGRTAPSFAWGTSSLALIPIMLLAWILFLGPPARFDIIFNVTAMFLILPAILWFGSAFQPPKMLRRACELMGDASYPLFAIHLPLLHIFFYVFAHRLGLPEKTVVTAFVPAAFCFAWLLFHNLDVPVRRWLSERSKLRPMAMPVQP